VVNSRVYRVYLESTEFVQGFIKKEFNQESTRKDKRISDLTRDFDNHVVHMYYFTMPETILSKKIHMRKNNTTPIDCSHVFI